MKLQKGFSLIELMIVVAIVAVIAMVAVPAYTSYMSRGKLVEAFSTLSTGRVQMEQSYQDNRTYNSSNSPCTSSWPASTTNFSYSCTSTASTYTITADNVASVGLGSAKSYEYTINESNVKATTVFPGSRTSTNTWISK